MNLDKSLDGLFVLLINTTQEGFKSGDSHIKVFVNSERENLPKVKY